MGLNESLAFFIKTRTANIPNNSAKVIPKNEYAGLLKIVAPKYDGS